MDSLKGNLAVRMANMDAITLLGATSTCSFESLLAHTADFLLERRGKKKKTFLFTKACVINPARTSVFNI